MRREYSLSYHEVQESDPRETKPSDEAAPTTPWMNLSSERAAFAIAYQCMPQSLEP